jgi:hypothetical protein
MRRAGDPQGTERAHLASVQPEAVEDRLLPLGQERPDPAETGRHLERLNLEFGPRVEPATKDAIGQVISHG